MRAISKVAPEWWDYTTLDREILGDVERLTPKDIQELSREGFIVKFYDTVEEFYLAEALEYVSAWQEATENEPVGICGPVGPTEQLPLVARIVNELNINLRHCHFWGMDEWVVNGKEVGLNFPLGFAKANMDLCFNRIKKELRIPEENIHFPEADTAKYKESWNHARCIVMQGGQGEIKHWAFNEPPKREGKYRDNPPLPEEYRNRKQCSAQ